MERTMLVAQFAAEIIKVQLNGGVKHPSPVLIKEAIVTASAVVDELDASLGAHLEDRLVANQAQSVDALRTDMTAAIASLQAKVDAQFAALVPAKPAPTPAALSMPATGSATPAGADTSKK